MPNFNQHLSPFCQLGVRIWEVMLTQNPFYVAMLFNWVIIPDRKKKNYTIPFEFRLAKELSVRHGDLLPT